MYLVGASCIQSCIQPNISCFSHVHLHRINMSHRINGSDEHDAVSQVRLYYLCECYQSRYQSPCNVVTHSTAAESELEIRGFGYVFMQEFASIRAHFDTFPEVRTRARKTVYSKLNFHSTQTPHIAKPQKQYLISGIHNAIQYVYIFSCGFSPNRSIFSERKTLDARTSRFRL